MIMMNIVFVSDSIFYQILANKYQLCFSNCWNKALRTNSLMKIVARVEFIRIKYREKFTQFKSIFKKLKKQKK